MDEINFNAIFYLVQYIQTSTYNKDMKISNEIFDFFPINFSEFSTYFYVYSTSQFRCLYFIWK